MVTSEKYAALASPKKNEYTRQIPLVALIVIHLTLNQIAHLKFNEILKNELGLRPKLVIVSSLNWK